MSAGQKERLEAIRTILEKKEVEDQASLVTLLEETYGIKSNQTSVSRDLRHLGTTKKMVAGKMIYDLPQVDASQEILRLAVVSVSHNEALIVIDTLPGLAGFVGDYLDMHGDLDLLGTLSGENALFATPLSTKNIKETFKKICTALKYKI